MKELTPKSLSLYIDIIFFAYRAMGPFSGNFKGWIGTPCPVGGIRVVS